MIDETKVEINFLHFWKDLKTLTKGVFVNYRYRQSLFCYQKTLFVTFFSNVFREDEIGTLGGGGFREYDLGEDFITGSKSHLIN